MKLYYRNTLIHIWDTPNTYDSKLSLNVTDAQSSYFGLFGYYSYYWDHDYYHIQLWNQTLTNEEMSAQVYMPPGNHLFYLLSIIISVTEISCS